MSGSYDRPPGRAFSGAPQGRDFDVYDDLLTGPPAGVPLSRHHEHGAGMTAETTYRATLESGPRPGQEMYAPMRERETGSSPRRLGAPIVPAGSVTGQSLTL